MAITRDRKLKMVRQVHHFYVSNSSVFNPLPQFPPLIAALNNVIEGIFNEEVVIAANMKGYTVAKSDVRVTVEELGAQVAKAVSLYGIANGQPDIIEPEDYLKSRLTKARDSELYVLAVQLHTKALPVQGGLAPYNSGPADVSALAAAAQSFLEQITVPRNNRKSRSRAVKKAEQLLKDADALLETSDNLMGVYRSVNPNLWSKYSSARKILKTGGGKNVHTKRGYVSAAHIAYAPFSPEVLKATSKLALSNENKKDSLVFYFSPSPKALPTPQSKMLSVAAGKTTETTATAAGYTALSPHLMVYNPNASKGKWKAEIVKK